MNYLGIDYGTKRIGLAIASHDTPPVPFATVTSVDAVADVIRNEQIDVVVIGRPKSMADRSTTAIEKKAEEFVKSLIAYGLPLTSIVYEDERLSSKGADALGKEFGSSGQRDAVAAMLILESYLGRIKK